MYCGKQEVAQFQISSFTSFPCPNYSVFTKLLLHSTGSNEQKPQQFTSPIEPNALVANHENNNYYYTKSRFLPVALADLEKKLNKVRKGSKNASIYF